MKPLIIVFTWFKPKPFILKPGVLNVKRCKRYNSSNQLVINENRNNNNLVKKKYNFVRLMTQKRREMQSRPRLLPNGKNLLPIGALS